MLDLVIRNARLVSVYTGEVFPAHVGVAGSLIERLYPLSQEPPAAQVLDAADRYLVPGFIDAHMHVESSYLAPEAYSELVLPFGTTTVCADPHEIVNAAGPAGFRWLARHAHGIPLDVLLFIPVCIPSLPGLETSAWEFDLAEARRWLEMEGVLGIGEVMDVYGQLERLGQLRPFFDEVRRRGGVIEGHLPGVDGARLQALLALGVTSDHTRNSAENYLEKARLGITLQLQEKDLDRRVVATLMSTPLPPPVCLVTDDVLPHRVRRVGHLNHVARVAIDRGMPPLRALRALTLEPALRFNLRDRGALCPGRLADMVLLDDLETLNAWATIKRGRVVAQEGRLTAVGCSPFRALPCDEPLRRSVRLQPPTASAFTWREEALKSVTARAILIHQDSTQTSEERVTLPVAAGEVRWQGAAALLVVLERHGRQGTVGRAPVVGLPLSRGAVATTHVHDAHNLLVLGTDPADMALAAARVVQLGGGLVVVADGRLRAELPLPLAGIVSDAAAAQVAAALQAVEAALQEWGYQHANPFMSLSALGLPVSPALKLTDRGLIDVASRSRVDVIVARE